MRLLASDIITHYRPSECELRTYLRSKGEPGTEPTEFDKVLQRLGVRHENTHLATLGTHLDLGGLAEEDRLQQTREAIFNRIKLIYQAAITADTTIDGTPVIMIGYPDFLLAADNGYIIRDSKLSLRIDEENHPEIILQVQLYGWLFERAFGNAPKGIEVYSGRGDIVQVPYDGGKAALEKLRSLVRLKRLGSEPFEAVGWSKCGGCCYNDRCWSKAEGEKAVATIPDVDQSLARELYAQGIRNRAELLSKYDTSGLEELKRPHGMRLAKVGKKAERILLQAQLLESGQERVIALPQIPQLDNYVMFDLEGMPPHLSELDKIYLWGAQVFGKAPSDFMAAVAGFGGNGDKEGYLAFLDIAAKLFQQYGDIPFVHWAPYEKTNVNKYIKRYGDPNGIAARVISNLLDLFTVAKNSIVLPLPSFSLKVVEKYVGFVRSQNDYGGDWAMATFIEATETKDSSRREELMAAIRLYNREDLEAMWFVFEWLRAKKPLAQAAHP
jgi:predicted RecB family nuclease